MRLGKPTTVLPPKASGRNDGKYAAIYNAVDKLKNGDWLPVTFKTTKEAYNFRIACETHRTRLLEATMRQCVIYVRKKKK